MAEGTCLVCLDIFKAHKRGYLRKSLTAKLRGQNITVKEGLHEIYPTVNIRAEDDNFVCIECFSCVGQTVKKKNELQQIRKKMDGLLKNPNIQAKTVIQDSSKSAIPSWKDGVRRALSKSKYLAVFRTLYKSSQSARAAMGHFLKNTVKRELALCPRQEGSCTMDTIQDFHWSTLIDFMEKSTPLFMAACQGAMARR